MMSLIRDHWEGAVMALFLTVAFALAGTLDEPPTIAQDGATKYASKE
jgi:hypothetical protein